MSTIKSSTDHLTLNADGASKDIKFQANGVEKASISSAGAFTSTTIDATALTGNLPAIDGGSLTGITHTPADNSVTLAKMAHGTDGELITYDAAGAPANVAVGTSGHVLTSGGAGVAPTFQAAAGGGGKVLQVVSGSTSTQVSTGGSGSWTSTGLTASITPANTANKILVIVTQWLRASTTCANKAALLRGGSEIGQWMQNGSCDYTIGDTQPHSYSITYVDSPGSTSSVTYNTGIKAGNGGTAYAQPYLNNTSHITLIELDYS